MCEDGWRCAHSPRPKLLCHRVLESRVRVVMSPVRSRHTGWPAGLALSTSSPLPKPRMGPRLCRSGLLWGQISRAFFSVVKKNQKSLKIRKYHQKKPVDRSKIHVVESICVQDCASHSRKAVHLKNTSIFQMGFLNFTLRLFRTFCGAVVQPKLCFRLFSKRKVGPPTLSRIEGSILV